MDFKKLEAFAWIARLGSFTAAARKLNTTQPAISLRVQQLERSLKTTLFEEPRRVANLTPHGRDLLEYAERILSLASEAQAKIGDPAAVAGRLRIGVGEAVALSWFPDLVARLNSMFPDVVIESEVDLTAGLWGKFDAGELELLLLPGPPIGRSLETRNLGSAKFLWMASPKLNLPSGRPLQPSDLKNLSIITLSRDSVLYQIAEDWFHTTDTRPKTMDICNSMAVVASLTVSGLGVSMLPPQIYRAEIDRGDLVILDIRPRIEPISYVCVHRKDREPGLVQLVSEIASKVSTFRETLDTGSRSVHR